MYGTFIPINTEYYNSKSLDAEGAVVLFGNFVDILKYKGETLMYFKHLEGDSAIKAKGYTGAIMALTAFKPEYYGAVYEFVWECMNVMVDLEAMEDLFLMPNERWSILSRCNETMYNTLGYYSDYREFLESSKGTPKEDTSEALTKQSMASEEVSKDTEGTPDKATHYKGAVEPLEVMSKLMSKAEFIGFLKGNIIKYSYRAGRKEGESGEKDRNKFLVYSDWLHNVTNGEPIVLGGKEITIK